MFKFILVPKISFFSFFFCLVFSYPFSSQEDLLINQLNIRQPPILSIILLSVVCTIKMFVYPTP